LKGATEETLWGGGGEDVPCGSKTGVQGPVFLLKIASRRLENLGRVVEWPEAQVEQLQGALLEVDGYAY